MIAVALTLLDMGGVLKEGWEGWKLKWRSTKGGRPDSDTNTFADTCRNDGRDAVQALFDEPIPLAEGSIH